MYLNIMVIDVLKDEGFLDTYRFIPKDQGNQIVIDRLKDIHTDVKGNSNKDIGMNRIYNSNKCELVYTCCQIQNYKKCTSDNSVEFNMEHMHIPVGMGGGYAGMYNLIIPIGYRLTEIYIVDPYDTKNKDIKKKKSFRFKTTWDKEKEVQLVEMELTSRRGSFSFWVYGKIIPFRQTEELYHPSEIVENIISFEPNIDEWLFDKEIKKTFLQKIKDSIILEPNFNGVGINFKKLFEKDN